MLHFCAHSFRQEDSQQVPGLGVVASPPMRLFNGIFQARRMPAITWTRSSSSSPNVRKMPETTWTRSSSSSPNVRKMPETIWTRSSSSSPNVRKMSEITWTRSSSSSPYVRKMPAITWTRSSDSSPYAPIQWHLVLSDVRAKPRLTVAEV